jgi:hypothetical protein
MKYHVDVLSTKYNVPRLSRSKSRDTRDLSDDRQVRLIGLCYEIRMVYEFPLLHSSFFIRSSTLPAAAGK